LLIDPLLPTRPPVATISLRDLAERADLRQPSLHVYFDSKLAL
jgi:AcrR family transcriptional regulator